MGCFPLSMEWVAVSSSRGSSPRWDWYASAVSMQILFPLNHQGNPGLSPISQHVVGHSNQRCRLKAAAGEGWRGFVFFFFKKKRERERERDITFLLLRWIFHSASVFVSWKFLFLNTRGRWSPRFRTLGWRRSRERQKSRARGWP